MHGVIAFILLFSLLTISLAADMIVYRGYDYFRAQSGIVELRAVSQHPWQFSYQRGVYHSIHIVIKHIPPNVTRHEVTLNTGQKTIKAKGGEGNNWFRGYSEHSEVKIKLDLFRSEVLCSSLLLAEGRSVESASAGNTARVVCDGACMLEVDLTNECVESENTTTVKAVLENVTYSQHDIIETTTIKVTTNGTSTTTSDNSTVTAICATFGVVVLLVVVIFVVWKCYWTYKSGTPQLLTTVNNFEPFYLNLLFRRECEREIEEIEQHVYDEIDPPVYEEIGQFIDVGVNHPPMDEEIDLPDR